MRAIIIYEAETLGALAVGDSLTFACGYVPVTSSKSKKWHLEHHPAAYGQVVEESLKCIGDVGRVPVYVVKVNNNRQYAAYVHYTDAGETIRFLDWKEFSNYNSRAKMVMEG